MHHMGDSLNMMLYLILFIKESYMKQLSRRQFLKGAAGASILGFLATTCGY